MIELGIRLSGRKFSRPSICSLHSGSERPRIRTYWTTVNLIAPPCLLCSWAPLQSSSRSLAPKLVGKWKLYVLKRPGFVPQCTPESLTLRDVRGEQGCRVFITDKFSWGQISFHLKCEEITSVFFFQLPRIRSVELDRKPELQIACTVKPDMKENTEWQENQSA